MNLLHNQPSYFILIFIITCFFTRIPAQNYDYSHRKRDCELKIITSEGAPVVTLIGIAQLSNDFVFGGKICSKNLDTLEGEYEEQFLSYFDCGVPEEEMEWEHVTRCPEKCDPDFSKADLLVDWMQKNQIPVHGSSLFSNGKEEWIPEWARDLEPTAFKQAMQEHINSAINHFKGKISQWDLLFEGCQEQNNPSSSSGILQTKSGDPDIFTWIMDKARESDPSIDFVINQCNIITSNDLTIADQFINAFKPLSSKFDIIGAQGHFGSSMDKSSYEPKINYLAEQLGKPVWLTEIDFSLDINQAPDKLEELMRTCFANPNVGGIFMENWYRSSDSDSNLTSYFIDSMGNETPAGQRWQEVRNEWKTVEGGYTDDSGKYYFNGFHGKYQILISCFVDSFYLEPGEGNQTIVVVSNAESGVNRRSGSLGTTEFVINGKTARISLPHLYNKQLFLTTYSLSGQQLSSSPISLKGGRVMLTPAYSCCRIIRIETVDRKPLYTGKVMEVR